MTSGSDASSDCRAAGADDFLMKPFMPDVLLAKNQSRDPGRKLNERFL
jgi:DNA-binding response OmpR family regulator